MLSPFAGSAIVSTKACGAGPNATVCYSRALGINSQLDRNLAVSTVLANDPNLYWNGRRVNVGASVMFDFPGVYVRFVVESTTIVAITVHDIVRQRYLAVLDGVEIGFFVTASTSTATYSVLSNLDVNSTYTVEIWKVTEVSFRLLYALGCLSSLLKASVCVSQAAAETNNSNPQPTTVQSLSFSAGASLLPPPQPSSLQASPFLEFRMHSCVNTRHPCSWNGSVIPSRLDMARCIQPMGRLAIHSLTQSRCTTHTGVCRVRCDLLPPPPLP